MNKIYIIVFSLLFSNVIHAESLNSIVMSDTLFNAISELQVKDSAILEENYRKNEEINKALTLDNYIEIMNMLHTNVDSVYQNDSSSYSIAKDLIQNFLQEEDGILNTYSKIGTGDFLEYNLKTYLARKFFQLFYNNNAQSELLRKEVQEKMRPDIINEMFKKTPDLAHFQSELIFIAKNSNYKLFKL